MCREGEATAGGNEERELLELAGGVFVATSSIDSTTSTVIVSAEQDDAGCVLVDPAWTPAELSALAAEITRRGWTVTAGLATHAHHDHLLWHPEFGAVPRWGSAGTVRAASEHHDELIGELGDESGSEPGRREPAWYRDLFARIDRVPGGSLPGAGEPMELIVHDAHAPGHTALWLPRRRTLVAGDMLSDVELPLPFAPDDVPAYLRGLAVLEPYVRRARLLIPGHGTPTTDPVARLTADLSYFDDVRAGLPSRDPRVGRPGMAGVDTRIRALAGGH